MPRFDAWEEDAGECISPLHDAKSRVLRRAVGFDCWHHGTRDRRSELTDLTQTENRELGTVFILHCGIRVLLPGVSCGRRELG